ncbi:hypothetical protein FF905_06600 [Bordetella pertussis]|nr:hypothetical protein FG003_11815 [Bordetella pertussis]QKC10442.1 hypothetical protein FF912_06930 [Bordetella pertussis]QKC14055.1 hypothetical protein FF905_06600 [Bordetella pertussis]QKC17658.1 hypothetical protein FF904_06595 [Bordetella pertussis]QKC21286.1 hypothetical protein FF903_06600 [Bordetella pertussis]
MTASYDIGRQVFRLPVRAAPQQAQQQAVCIDTDLGFELCYGCFSPQLCLLRLAVNCQ